MPLPQPRADEDQGDFILRCMADETTVREYPDAKQRRAICQTQWARRDSGLAQRWLASRPLYGLAAGAVELEAGVIKGAAVVAAGEAQGHGFFLDEEFVDDVVHAGNATGDRGLKARFGHPNMSSTALGTFLGRWKHFRRENGAAKADLYLSAAAAETPQGNLRDYVLKLATEDPKAFGASIVFQPGREYQRGPEGEKLREGDNLWDPNAPVCVDLAKLHAADLVDDPAANPDGLLSAFNVRTFAGQMTEFLDTHPKIFELVDQNPGVMDEFLARYREYQSRRQLPAPAADAADGSDNPHSPHGPDGPSRKEIVMAEIATVQELKAEFGDNPEFVIEQLEAQATLEAARAQYKDVQIAELRESLELAQNEMEAANEELAELAAKAKAEADAEAKTKAPAAPQPDAAVAFGGSPEASADFMAAARERQRADGLATLTQAMSLVTREQPELYRRYRESMA